MCSRVYIFFQTNAFVVVVPAQGTCLLSFHFVWLNKQHMLIEGKGVFLRVSLTASHLILFLMKHKASHDQQPCMFSGFSGLRLYSIYLISQKKKSAPYSWTESMALALLAAELTARVGTWHALKATVRFGAALMGGGGKHKEGGGGSFDFHIHNTETQI